VAPQSARPEAPPPLSPPVAESSASRPGPQAAPDPAMPKRSLWSRLLGRDDDNH
jgi:hypothetical protein